MKEKKKRQSEIRRPRGKKMNKQDIINDLKEMVVKARYYNKYYDKDYELKVSPYMMQIISAEASPYTVKLGFKCTAPSTFCGMPIQVDYDLKGYKAYIMKVVGSRVWGNEND